ncbi:hypothetical protein ABS735_28340 [Streptomyces sp. MMCC 100]|uniref:hypothetical protein n=1 Tax=Streptomyces sp. MMCC 100 TaxID=3163555 RepID=UPI003594C852
MKIRILVSQPPGAVLHGRPWPTEGTVVDDLPTTVAAHLVASGVAEEVPDAPPARRRKSRKEHDDG